MADVLVVEDKESLRAMLRKTLEVRGYSVDEAGDAYEARRRLQAGRYLVVLTDLRLPAGSGFDVLEAARDSDAEMPVVVMTAFGTVDEAVKAMKQGAADFLTKPVDTDHLMVLLDRAIDRRRLLTDYVLLKEEYQRRFGLPRVLGEDPALRETMLSIQRAAATDATVLLLGESGTGKELMARSLHQLSARAKGPFVAINCAAIPETLLENELFGHEKGAFTGASADKPGLLEVAHRGSVFLDEIGDVDVAVQPKLLKVLEEKRYRRLGDVRDRKVDIRLIAATHQDLHGLIVQGRFRSDLFFRISTLPLAIPPLRERVEDIPTLAADLLAPCAADLARSPIRLSPDAMAALQSYSWPGNIRELRNVLERAALLCEGDVLSAHDLHFQCAPAPPAPLAGMTLDELERLQIDRVVREEHGRVSQASRRLGISRGTLYQKIKKYGIVQFES